MRPMERFHTPALIALATIVLALGVWQFTKTRSNTEGLAGNETATVADENQNSAADESEQTDVAATVSLMVDFGDGRIPVYPEVATTDPTVLGALTAASRDAAAPFTLTADASGITRIGDKTNTPSLRWQFWVNNEYGEEPGLFEIFDGDVLLVKYVKPQPTETPKP